MAPVLRICPILPSFSENSFWLAVSDTFATQNWKTPWVLRPSLQTVVLVRHVFATMRVWQETIVVPICSMKTNPRRNVGQQTTISLLWLIQWNILLWNIVHPLQWEMTMNSDSKSHSIGFLLCTVSVSFLSLQIELVSRTKTSTVRYAMAKIVEISKNGIYSQVRNRVETNLTIIKLLCHMTS